jgi:hypothetical protein
MEIIMFDLLSIKKNVVTGFVTNIVTSTRNQINSLTEGTKVPSFHEVFDIVNLLYLDPKCSIVNIDHDFRLIVGASNTYCSNDTSRSW